MIKHFGFKLNQKQYHNLTNIYSIPHGKKKIIDKLLKKMTYLDLADNGKDSLHIHVNKNRITSIKDNEKINQIRFCKKG